MGVQKQSTRSDTIATIVENKRKKKDPLSPPPPSLSFRPFSFEFVPFWFLLLFCIPLFAFKLSSRQHLRSLFIPLFPSFYCSQPHPHPHYPPSASSPFTMSARIKGLFSSKKKKDERLPTSGSSTATTTASATLTNSSRPHSKEIFTTNSSHTSSSSFVQTQRTQSVASLASSTSALEVPRDGTLSNGQVNAE